MQVVAQFEPNVKTNKALNKLPDDVLYGIARETLDMSVKFIPMSIGTKTSSNLRRTSVAGGVREDNDGYYIGSFTEYASHVWNMNDSTTNWSTPNTHSQWYARTLRLYGQVILDTAINHAWKDNM